MKNATTAKQSRAGSPVLDGAASTENATMTTETKYAGSVISIVPLRACFSFVGTKEFYIVRVSNPQYKGSPWAVATLQDNAFKIDSCWMRTQKSAYREFKSSDRETAYFLHEVPANAIKTLTY